MTVKDQVAVFLLLLIVAIAAIEVAGIYGLGWWA